MKKLTLSAFIPFPYSIPSKSSKSLHPPVHSEMCILNMTILYNICIPISTVINNIRPVTTVYVQRSVHVLLAFRWPTKQQKFWFSQLKLSLDLVFSTTQNAGIRSGERIRTVSIITLKEQCHDIFRLWLFFVKQRILVPNDISGKDFELGQIFGGVISEWLRPVLVLIIRELIKISQVRIIHYVHYYNIMYILIRSSLPSVASGESNSVMWYMQRWGMVRSAKRCRRCILGLMILPIWS
jgi:hypothetical protein